MKGNPYRRLSPAMVVASIALAIALGGTSYAAVTLPRNSVGTRQLRNAAVVAAKIRNSSVTSRKIKNGQVTGADVNEATLGRVPKAITASHSDAATNAAALGGVAAAKYATRLWAHVSDGTLDRGSGVTSVSGSDGVYRVVFDQSIRNCAAFGTISRDNSDYSTNGINGANGTIQAYPVIAPGVETIVMVVTTLPDGKTRASYDFNVMVMC